MVDIGELDEYLKASMVKTGDVLELVNEGEIRPKEETEFDRDVFEITVKLPNGDEKPWTMNATSVRAVGAVLGTETKNWPGNRVKIKIVTQQVFKEMKDVIYVDTVLVKKKGKSKK